MKSKWTMAVCLLVCAGAVLPSYSAKSQTYPTRPIRLIVPFPAGGPTDVQARILSHEMSKTLGEQIVVDNRGGAGGSIGAEAAAAALADGYTIFFATAGTHGANSSIYKKLSYDPIKNFDAIALISTTPNIFVTNPKLPANNMAELIDYARKNPGKINYGTAGIGSTTHMSAELLQSMTGIKLVHVPYRGGGPAMSDLIAGQVELMVDALPTALPHIKSGSIKALGVTTRERAPSEPDIPTVAETVPGYEVSAWFGLVAPKGTPKEVIAKLNEEANKVLATEAVKSRFAELGMKVGSGSPQEFQKRIVDEVEKWPAVMKATGFQPQ
ncbi:Bug family tripartite tricarboxylate transporter substrate binding protein [Tardiphaga sp. 367_B4_N1_1]|uniref:Bug family tripartite tricarboxylate transporter substrate binding protein n=1 Tax=Tardiphaga sp. 367_B4_N1_1 TaxID=3240777 RepID=UPI003F266749